MNRRIDSSFVLLLWTFLVCVDLGSHSEQVDYYGEETRSHDDNPGRIFSFKFAYAPDSNVHLSGLDQMSMSRTSS